MNLLPCYRCGCEDVFISWVTGTAGDGYEVICKTSADNFMSRQTTFKCDPPRGFSLTHGARAKTVVGAQRLWNKMVRQYKTIRQQALTPGCADCGI